MMIQLAPKPLPSLPQQVPAGGGLLKFHGLVEGLVAQNCSNQMFISLARGWWLPLLWVELGTSPELLLLVASISPFPP